MSRHDYTPLVGQQARTLLNEMGFSVQGHDDIQQAVLGLLVVMAQELTELREQVAIMKSRLGYE